ncbi:accessory gene regulator B family protein [Anaerophilus nitritogenes]|uniref:accessory gene regulator B family protein n=1 Tax=Anaerophilus nitritogenes TaxID=2498136 RepID=UPI00101CE825|nr:accessory gene regulator B family protein [Anaerophilus nitritogenes]
MINIENISEKIFSLAIFSQVDNTQRLKAQYGFSVVLGIIIEFLIASSISYFLGVFKYLWPMMITALIFKETVISQHCTSFDRCIVFTCIYFLGASFIMKYMCKFYLYTIEWVIVSICILNFSILLIQRAMKGFHLIVILYICMICIYFINKNYLIYMLSIFIGCFLKIFSCTKIGKSFVIFCDHLLMKVGIK